MLTHIRPDGSTNFNSSDFRRRLAPRLGVPPEDVVLNCSAATHPQSLPEPQTLAQRQGIQQLSGDLDVHIKYISDIYHSFCVAPAPPPSPPPPTYPPSPPPPARPPQAVWNTTQLHAALADTDVSSMRLQPGDYVLAERDAFTNLCSPPRQSLIIEGAASVSAQPHLHVTPMAGRLEISCSIHLVNVRVSLAASALAVRVGALGSLLLSGQARIEGELDIQGVVRYEMLHYFRLG